jgi:hypothetical protein
VNSLIPKEISDCLNSIVNLKCWYVNCGKGVGSSFSISLGKKIARKRPLTNLKQSEEYRHYEGEVNLLIWCSWRLDNAEKPITSSDEDVEKIEQGLNILFEKVLLKIEVIPPAWDLVILFSEGYQLRIFCDHLPGGSSYDGNWDLKVGEKILFAGPGIEWGIEMDE